MYQDFQRRLVTLSPTHNQGEPQEVSSEKINTEDLMNPLDFNFQKNPRVHKIFVGNSGAGNGCANFMGTWKNCIFSAGKPMSIKFLVLGEGGGFWVFFGGGESADFIFMGARIFLKLTLARKLLLSSWNLVHASLGHILLGTCQEP